MPRSLGLPKGRKQACRTSLYVYIDATRHAKRQGRGAGQEEGGPLEQMSTLETGKKHEKGTSFSCFLTVSSVRFMRLRCGRPKGHEAGRKMGHGRWSFMTSCPWAFYVAGHDPARPPRFLPPHARGSLPDRLSAGSRLPLWRKVKGSGS